MVEKQARKKNRNSAWQVLRRCGRQLVATDLVFKIIAFAVLTPLLGLLFRVLLALAGRSSLVGMEFLDFFLGPLGWLAGLAVAAFWLAIIAWEQVTLLAILVAATFKANPRIVPALRLAAETAPTVLQATVWMVTRAALWGSPFLAGLGLVYWALLSRFDINFYLTAKPWELWVAVGLATVLGISLLAVWIRLASGWFFTLPLIVFERMGPRQALRESMLRAQGQRPRIAIRVAAWLVLNVMATALILGGVTWLAHRVILWSTGALWSLLAAAGTMVTLWMIANWLTDLLASISFAVLLAHLYRHYGRAERIDLDRVRQLQGEGENALRLTTRRLAWALLASVVVAAGVGWLTLQSVRLADHTEIVAHRGAAGTAPENTLAAVRAAIDQGADWIEIDVQQTRDGEVVVLHDSDLQKIAGDPRTIWSIAAADLAEIDVGSRTGPEFAAERVPTLRQVLALCRERGARLNIELKYYGKARALEQTLAARVLQLVREAGMESHVVYMSLERAAVAQMKALAPTARVGWLTAVVAGNLWDTPADFLAVQANLAHRRLLRAAHRRGKQVLAWTVNDPVSMSLLIGRGVDGLITDYPARGREVLALRAEYGLAERFLLELAGIFGITPQVVAE